MKTLSIDQATKVTPSLAKEWLKQNKNNRPISMTRVEKYTSDMLQGKWLFSGDTIRFDSQGRLIDGQKRLMAILQSGKPQPFFVVGELPPKTFEVIDSQQTRSGADTLAVMGVSSYAWVAAAIRLAVISGFNPKWTGGTRTHRQGVPNWQIREWYLAHRDIETMAQEANQMRVEIAPFLPGGPMLFAMYWCKELTSWKKAFHFMTQCAYGEQLSRGDPAFEFRRRMAVAVREHASRRSRIQQQYRLAIFFRAWNHYVKGEKPNRIVWKAGRDRFPTPCRR